jgi:hypothetical protein
MSGYTQTEGSRFRLQIVRLPVRKLELLESAFRARGGWRWHLVKAELEYRKGQS